MNWQYFILGIITYLILRMLILAIRYEIREHRQKQFLKLVSIRFPDKQDITFISIDTSDKQTMKQLEKELFDQFGLQEEKS